MGRKPAPQPLSLPGASHAAAAAAAPNNDPPTETAPPGASLSPADSARSPESARSSPLSIPSSRFAAPSKRPQTAAGPRTALQQPADDAQQHRSQSANGDADSPYPPMPSAVPPQHQHQPAGPQANNGKLRHAYTEGKKSSKGGFFHFNKASKTSNQLQPNAHHHHDSRSQVISGGSDGTSASRREDTTYPGNSLERPVLSQPSRSDLSLSSAGDYESAPTSAPSSARKTKPKPFGLLTRTKSTRDNINYNSPREPQAPLPVSSSNTDLRHEAAPLRTAPVAQDRAFRDMMNSSVRNRSEDRAPPVRAPTREMAPSRESHRENYRPPPPARENGGSFFSGLRNSSTKAADIISKGLFGKSSRAGAMPEKEHTVDDEQYVVKVINLPLVQQTRITRISKRLETSRDKTEFWMPAFPWRAIDYLNYKGCDVEGLYRVPGSGPQIKKWQRRFDEEHDVNLFEEEDLYDINIVGSMLKAWLRELPDELFPKAAQDRVARECAGSEEVPQMLIDELSNLPPFNYYLLFAITCHLSLLLAHSDKNKMDFRNLCICFQPCMKIDAFSFKFLVCDWRDCWKGCSSEAQYIEEEYKLFDLPPPRALTEVVPDVHVQTDVHGEEERKHSTSSSSKQSAHTPDEQPRTKPKPLPLSQSNTSIGSNSSLSTALTANSERDHIRVTSDLRPLSPIQPLSPIGFGSDSP